MPDIAWGQTLDHLLHILGANVLALPSAIDQEVDSNAHLMKGLIGGFGFLGGGPILKCDDGVAGTATAASIRNTGAIGMAVAFQRHGIAIVLAALNFFTLKIGKGVKASIGDEPDHDQTSG